MDNEEEWERLYYQITIDDIEKTKRRLYEISYYTAALYGTLLFVTDHFEKNGLANGNFYISLFIAALVIFLVASYLILENWASLEWFRRTIAVYDDEGIFPERVREIRLKSGRLKEIKKKGQTFYRRTTHKGLRDFPIKLFQIFFPVGGFLIVTYFILSKLSG
jgi:hypothetical protein